MRGARLGRACGQKRGRRLAAAGGAWAAIGEAGREIHFHKLAWAGGGVGRGLGRTAPPCATRLVGARGRGQVGTSVAAPRMFIGSLANELGRRSSKSIAVNCYAVAAYPGAPRMSCDATWRC
ncbi:jg15751 [Pararge aegeria aegeria]|uniref:Jg15751 protein n=1 Tax=Pararge aegeria aegeria TaxID=348720 RepID=A0A8S4RJ24_9NEOP|nr:jg15751 [Pararge aegeria aegeria]